MANLIQSINKECLRYMSVTHLIKPIMENIMLIM
jgi:hypothetical protein